MKTRKLGRTGLELTTVGARYPGQAEESAGAADWELPPEDAAEIEAQIARRPAAA